MTQRSDRVSRQDKKIGTIRDDIHRRYPELAALVDQQFPSDSRGPDAFKYALELYLRALPNLDAAVDGFTHLDVVKETATTLRAVGISYVLPSSQLPIDAKFRVARSAIEYRILVGSDDETWNALTEPKRWKAVYLYATEGAVPDWNWDQPVEGTLNE